MKTLHKNCTCSNTCVRAHNEHVRKLALRDADRGEIEAEPRALRLHRVR